MADDNHLDAIVLGLGGMGSATLQHLAERGATVIGIDQHVVPHDFGSSHGTLRVIRKAYFEHPDYVPLLERAYELWDAFDERAGGGLFVKNGLIITGAPDSETILGLEACYAEHALPHEKLSSADANIRFAPYRTPEGHVLFHDPLGGYLRVEDCIAASLRFAEEAGAEIRFGEEVLSWEASDSVVCVVTDKGIYSTEHLILTPGPWATGFLDELGVDVSVTRKMQVWYGAAGLEGVDGTNFPCFASETDYGFYYGFPPVDSDGLKVAAHLGGAVVEHPDDLDRDITPEDERFLIRFLGDYLPHLEPHRTRHSACLYTDTADGDFIVDRHPKHDNVVFAAGMSGHGFKFAPVLAQALAELALDGGTGLPIEFLGLDRLLRSTT